LIRYLSLAAVIRRWNEIAHALSEPARTRIPQLNRI